MAWLRSKPGRDRRHRKIHARHERPIAKRTLRAVAPSTAIRAAPDFFRALPAPPKRAAASLWAARAFRGRALCKAICDGGGAYPFTVKANRPTLMADIAESFGDASPPCAERGAG